LRHAGVEARIRRAGAVIIEDEEADVQIKDDE